jgi:hypothetical protein
MATWKVARRSRTSAASGLPIPAGSAVVTALFAAGAEAQDEDVPEDRVRGAGFVRKDFLAEEATPQALEGAFCVWRSKAPEEAPRAPRLDLAAAQDLLDRLLADGAPERAGACLALALLLVRKRRLAIVSEREGVLVVRRPRETETFEVPAPRLSEAEELELERELSRLFE